MDKQKNVNYSDELTANVVKQYTEAADSDEARSAVLESLSAETGKTVKSLRAKLTREKVYISKTYKAKTGNKAETKDVIVQSIAKILNVSEAKLAGLENATKPALELLRASFVEASQAIADAQAEASASE